MQSKIHILSEISQLRTRFRPGGTIPGILGSSALSVQFQAAFEISQGNTMALRSSKLARPYICRLIASSEILLDIS